VDQPKVSVIDHGAAGALQILAMDMATGRLSQTPEPSGPSWWPVTPAHRTSSLGEIMTVDPHSHHIEDPNATTPPPQIELVLSVPTPPVPDPSEAMTIRVTLPPGCAGSPPHRHTGPAFGYVIEGEMIFELEGEPERVVRAGETFWEPGGDVIHYQDGNNLADAETRFVVTMFGVPGQPMLIPVSAEELEERRSRRAPRP
jgi:quercetin dioxygenase-like cupin family protein